MSKTRLIKFVGDPVLVKEDGWGVPNWRYENNRVIAPGRNRHLRPGDAADWEYDANGKPLRAVPGTGITREYYWDRRNLSRIIEVHIDDAFWILKNAGNEFKDVTDEPNPDLIENDRIVVKAKPKDRRGATIA